MPTPGAPSARASRRMTARAATSRFCLSASASLRQPSTKPRMVSTCPVTSGTRRAILSARSRRTISPRSLPSSTSTPSASSRASDIDEALPAGSSDHAWILRPVASCNFSSVSISRSTPVQRSSSSSAADDVGAARANGPAGTAALVLA
ncbi:MAG: hypothetical protein A2138_05905 [Deltaproteobacteria bacterium RBG_16_71_12]|nr:MAG: hypothetical protein A2138_05905 [Deltaproteobacteria bacterium RBG_16_71_12]